MELIIKGMKYKYKKNPIVKGSKIISYVEIDTNNWCNDAEYNFKSELTKEQFEAECIKIESMFN